MATETEIANLGLGKLGGAGEALGGNAFIDDINGTDKVSSWLKLNFPRARRRVITDLAVRECPFRSTVRFKDLGAELASSSIPEIGQYLYAFNLPGHCLAVVMQFNENYTATRNASRGSQSNIQPITYKWDMIANKAGTGKILLTNTLSNIANTSAFIEYVRDTPNTGGFSEELIDCIATLLASEVGPMVGYTDRKTADEMLFKYREIAIPNAQRANQFGFNNRVRQIPDVSGGRSSRATPALESSLGTYTDAQGNRRSI